MESQRRDNRRLKEELSAQQTGLTISQIKIGRIRDSEDASGAEGVQGGRQYWEEREWSWAARKKILLDTVVLRL